MTLTAWGRDEKTLRLQAGTTPRNGLYRKSQVTHQIRGPDLFPGPRITEVLGREKAGGF